jgi:electron transport complex protein RnfA
LSSLLPILFGAVLINVLVLEDAAGLRLFGEGSDQISDLLLGCLVIAGLLAAAVAISYPIEQWVLPRWEAAYLEPLLLMLIITSLIEGVVWLSPGRWTRVSFPRARMTFVLANAAILAVAVSTIGNDQPFATRLILAALLGAMFALAMAAYAALAYRLRTADTPRTLRGLPIAVITAGILCLAFTALAGLFR